MPFSLLQHPVFACGMSIREKHQGHSVSCFKPGFLLGLKGQVGHFTERMKQDSAAPVSYTHLYVYKRQILYHDAATGGLNKTAFTAVLQGSMFSKPCAPAQGRVPCTRAAAQAAALRL